MKNTIIGFPRIGKLRELKFVSEKYFRGEATKQELLNTAKSLRKEHWQYQKNADISLVTSNDFSLYDNVLDTAVLLNVIPDKYKDLNLDEIDTYFAMSRGYQGDAGDVSALAMKKWFNTNYHYLVPEINDDTEIKLVGDKPFTEFEEAKSYNILTKPVLIGPYTFLKLASYQGQKTAISFADAIANAYSDILSKFNDLGAEWIQFDEPSLVRDLSADEIDLFAQIYKPLLSNKGQLKILLQTYFGDVRDCYSTITDLEFDGIGLDFLEGKQNISLIKKFSFPNNKVLFAGLINGKNIWKSNYSTVLNCLTELKKYADNIVLSTSCSLLHVPYTLSNESCLAPEVSQYFSFALEKLTELHELSLLSSGHISDDLSALLENNSTLFLQERIYKNDDVKNLVANLKDEDFIRLPIRSERQKIQKENLNLPLFPTTTIGSFPQTIEVKQNRTRFRKGEIDKKTYDKKIREFIDRCIKTQEEIGIDVLVHGEFERNDMVEFFGENLDGYVFTEKAWVQSYGTRCVKPPIIFGDIKRTKPITTQYLEYAQSLTDKPVKGMLTGPVTILNWSFPREDISHKEMAYQIAIAIREEVHDLEAAGIKIIQIDEAALKEKLPIRKSDWYTEYLDWAIPAFRLCHSAVKPETQIHTHMCYSEFNEIIKDIDNMDADVISFEASRSKLTILDAIKNSNFETEVGPGVYDIHSPRVPSTEEITNVLRIMLNKIDKDKLWVNPDCGLKTRGQAETVASLKNLVAAANAIRNEF
ncbi:MAG: 5-methyltetrahydropteroyltriglutamate--homocysteine S-methyltransferase [Lachnospiraceae bacterium]|nr:5-methyltetrahydropteroyltriglutamate--homocysteine S-methyltransferase [Lachnospiraceae bacterium]